MPEKVRKLYRSTGDRMIGGVCGGVGKYFGVDPTLIRLLFVFLIFLGLSGIIVYLAALIIVPLESRGEGPSGT